MRPDLAQLPRVGSPSAARRREETVGKSRSMHVTRLGLVLSLNAFLVQPCVATEQAAPLPQWLLKAMKAERKVPCPGSFEEATYEGKRVFEFVRGDRFDTGDEHTLFSEDGKEICKFGGFVGQVTSGVCSIERITYVRTL